MCMHMHMLVALHIHNHKHAHYSCMLSNPEVQEVVVLLHSHIAKKMRLSQNLCFI